MKKLALILIFLSAAHLVIAAQDTELKIPAEIAPFVEQNTKAIALEKADLDGDGTQDFVLVLEDLKAASEDEEGARSLLILTRGADGKLSLAKRNDKGVVYCRSCGGVFGDPFAGVTAAPKSFTVSMYGGSNWRWSFDYKFSYSRIDKTWQLVRVEETTFHVFEPNKMKSKIYTPPKSFGKIDIADFDPENYLKKSAREQ